MADIENTQPSLEDEVAANRVTDERISISFNFNWS